MPELLVVAGEASGDRIAASVVRALALRGVRAFGLGGPACVGAGVALASDLEATAAMGFTDVARRLPHALVAASRLALRVGRSRPAAALLVDAPELNARIGPWLRRRGVPVVWCVAPQVWAWRAGRLASLRGAFDRLAVILPFEEALWRNAGHDARYVGHPSALAPAPSRRAARAALGIPVDARAVAVLPGSRPGEIARLAEPLLDAAERLVRGGRVDLGVVVLAASLPARSRATLTRAATHRGLALAEPSADDGAASLLAAFDVALAASGTASLEAALAGAPPVVVARLDRLAYAVATRLVRTPHVALPNVVLGRRAFPELVQDEVTPAGIERAAAELLDASSSRDLDVAELRARLAPPDAGTFGDRVAHLLAPWV